MALELTERRSRFGGVLTGIRNLLTKPRSDLAEVNFPGGSYARIRTETRRGQVDWESVAELAGWYGDRLLLPDGFAVPTDSPLREAVFPRCEREMLVATGCALIDATKMPMYRRVCGLIDPAGDHAATLPRLLRHFTTVRVATNALAVYRAAADDMMDQLGAPCFVDRELSSLGDCVLILAPGACPAADPTPLPCPVLAGCGFSPNAPWGLVSDLRIGVPDALLKYQPAGIAPHHFGAALYEYSDAKDLSPVAETMLYNGQLTDFMQIVKIIQVQSGTDRLF